MAKETDGRARRRPKEETRRAILDEAKQLFTEQGAPERIDLRLSAVLRRMELTSGAAYNIWESQEEFQSDLALEMARDFFWAGPTTTDLDIDLAAEDPMSEVRRLADAYFEAFTEVELFYLTLRFWGTRDPSIQLREAVNEGYRVNRDAWIGFYELGLDWAGRRIRHPFTMDDFMVAATAILEGCALRHRFDPAALETAGGHHLHGEMLVAVIGHFTEAKPPPRAPLDRL